MTQFQRPESQGLYNPKNEHDACGVGFVANIHGTKSHTIVAQGLQILTNLTHRGATGYDPKLGDGAGILIQMPDGLIRDETKKLSLKEVSFFEIILLIIWYIIFCQLYFHIDCIHSKKKRGPWTIQQLS